MLRAFLFPALVASSCALLQFIFSRSRGIPEGPHPVFRFSTGLVVFLSLGAVGFPLVPIAIWWPHVERIETTDWISFGLLSFVEVMGAIYAKYYTLTLWDDHLSYGIFKYQDIDYKDIVSAELTSVGGGRQMLIIKTPKKRVSISGYLESIDDAARLLKSKLDHPSLGLSN